MIKFFCCLAVVIVVSTYGLWLNMATPGEKLWSWSNLGILLGVCILAWVFFSALYCVLFFTKTVWGMI